MYPVRLGFVGAIQRVKDLSNNGHHAEALVTTTFTIEKTLRRTLRQLVLSAGFPSEQADKITGNLRGLEAIKSAWELYDPRHRQLLQMIHPNDWNACKEAADMRNKLVHGERVYSLPDCKQKTEQALKSLEKLKKYFDGEYGYSGWTTAKSRKASTLHNDPKVTWSKEKPS